jgi:hypothetical protein
MKRSRDIRAERRAKELARYMGWNSPMPDREDGEPGEKPAQDERVPVDVAPQRESAHG